MASGTRYQILYLGKDKDKKPTENFTEGEKSKAKKRFEELKAAGFDVAFWDTLNNSLSNHFSSILGGRR